MTDTTDTSEATETVDTDAEATTAVPEPAPDEAQSTEGDGEAQGDAEAHDDRQDRDAAKYRRRLRETEAERDGLAAQVEALQRAAVDARATADGVKPAALWASGVALADLLTDDGAVDTDKVAAACSTARESLGLGPRHRISVPGEGANHATAPAGNGREAMVDVVMGRTID